MKRIKQFLFNFNVIYFYTYIAGILVSFAVNFSFKTEGLPVSVYRFKKMAFAILISSIGAFGISTFLEIARREWESHGSPKDSVAIRKYIEKQGKFLWPCLVLISFGLITVICYLFI